MHCTVIEHQLIVAFVWYMHVRSDVDDGCHCLRLGLSLSLKLASKPRDLPVPTSLALGLALCCIFTWNHVALH